MRRTSTEAHVAAILNAAWMVRHYALQRTETMRQQRARAVREMGLLVREAFNNSDDFEALLAAIVNGLSPKDERTF